MSRSPVPSAPGAPPSHNGYVAIPRKVSSVRGVGAVCWPEAVLTRLATIQSVAMLLKPISLFYRELRPSFPGIESHDGRPASVSCDRLPKLDTISFGVGEPAKPSEIVV